MGNKVYTSIASYLDIHLSENTDAQTFGAQVYVVNLCTNSAKAHIVA